MIESYDLGRIVIDGRKFGSDVVIFPDRIDGNWWRKEGHTPSVDDVKEIVNWDRSGLFTAPKLLD